MLDLGGQRSLRNKFLAPGNSLSATHTESPTLWCRSTCTQIHPQDFRRLILVFKITPLCLLVHERLHALLTVDSTSVYSIVSRKIKPIIMYFSRNWSFLSQNWEAFVVRLFCLNQGCYHKARGPESSCQRLQCGPLDSFGKYEGELTNKLIKTSTIAIYTDTKANKK